MGTVLVEEGVVALKEESDKFMFLLSAWTWSLACCCLSWLSFLLLKSLRNISQGGHSLLIGQMSLVFLQFFIEHLIMSSLSISLWFVYVNS